MLAVQAEAGDMTIYCAVAFLGHLGLAKRNVEGCGKERHAMLLVTARPVAGAWSCMRKLCFL